MMDQRTVHVEDQPRWKRLLWWLRDSYGRRIVEIREDGEPVAYIVGPAFARAAATLAERWHDREYPYTQKTLDSWLAAELADWDVSELEKLVEGPLADE